ncbi:hypothetical protein LWI29_012799 [Acer saccharum]|uniref:TatD related DNase n=1 Tax=Acer saccharum TaxID=4024 RepID=A0AA39SZE1_ACESA|nr:hypothetical protein LWI29_012799 [Acer saccharum]
MEIHGGESSVDTNDELNKFEVSPDMDYSAVDSVPYSSVVGTLKEIYGLSYQDVIEKKFDSVEDTGLEFGQRYDERYSSVIPCYGVHPWFIEERTPNWFTSLKDLFATTPSAAIGEIGLDKGSRGREIDFTDQVEVFRQQLELAKELKRPASIHCVRAFGDMLEIMKSVGPFPAGVILHSYLGSAEMVPEFSKLGAYFSFSGFLMSMKAQKAKKMLKRISMERILLETDAPDALPNALDSLFLVDGDPSLSQEVYAQKEGLASNVVAGSDDQSPAPRDSSTLPKEHLIIQQTFITYWFMLHLC